ncbi:Hypothetical protein P9303_16691 [Prochlorococcus marinus str. MIT 9303]|uniref:Uncharacterized protein n=1 Tax=Prochlorococcus marinus (strain MIT 9303) TaxID=59922 RepID=A2CAA3_PROM3|nr:Hypothetical protein P9303_16691 [Prochlorococcus marinus str. MIT 9303]
MAGSNFFNFSFFNCLSRFYLLDVGSLYQFQISQQQRDLLCGKLGCRCGNVVSANLFSAAPLE